jgi:serine/threonine-protein kinase
MKLSLRQLGPFQIQKQLSQRRGMGAFFAIDTRTKQTVVLYVLDLHTQPDPTLAPRFRQAVRQSSQLRHDHIVALHESGEQDHYLYIATVPLAGTTLAAYLQQRKNPLTMQEAATLIQQIASGLDAAHQQDCFHLALTPDEIWITEDGKAQVLGLGVPRPARVAGVETLAGALDLSPYTAPEQVQQDAQINHRADVYSLGAIAYMLLVGQPPLQAEDPAQLATAIIHRAPVPPEHLQPNLPHSINPVFRFVLAKDPELRYANAAELAAALMQAQHWDASEAKANVAASPIRLRRLPNRRLVGVLLLLPMIVFAGVWLASRQFRQAAPEQLALDPLAAVAAGGNALNDRPLDDQLSAQTTPIDDRILALTVMATGAATATGATTMVATALSETPGDLQAGAAMTATDGITPTSIGEPASERSLTSAASSTPTPTAPQPTASDTPVSTATRTLAPTSTPAPTATSTATPQPTASDTPAPTATLTLAPTNTPAPTNLPTATSTATPQPTASDTPAPTATSTLAPTNSPTATSTSRPQPAASDTPAPTATSTLAPARLPTPTRSLATATPLAVWMPVAATPTANSWPTLPSRSMDGATTPASLLRPQSQEFTLYFPLVKYQLALQGRVVRNANLRAGPGVNFPVLGNARAGETLTLMACNAGCTWYQLANRTWIAAFLVQSATNPSQLLPQSAPTSAGE